MTQARFIYIKISEQGSLSVSQIVVLKAFQMRVHPHEHCTWRIIVRVEEAWTGRYGGAKSCICFIATQNALYPSFDFEVIIIQSRGFFEPRDMS